MSQTDLDILSSQLSDYKRTPEIFNQAIATEMLNSLEKIHSSILPEDETLYKEVIEQLKVVAFPPVPVIPVPPPLNPADISPILLDIKNTVI
jgi:hypothetical protein